MSQVYQENLVSVIMPTYNSSSVLEASIASIQKQGYQNWELLVVDDCSKDGTQEILRQLAKRDMRIRPFFQTENRGSGFARNEGLSKARGRFVAFLDSDDLWHPDKLEEQLVFMKTHGYGFTFTAYHVFEEQPTAIKRTVRVPRKINYQQLLKNTIIGCLTVMIDREKVGDFRMPLLRARQDTATWLSILKEQDYAYGLTEPLAYYRVSATSLSSNKWRMLKKNWQMYRECEGLNIVYASYVFSCYVCNALWKRRRQIG
ncbi:glycosyltransferase family 2 protein [Listeria booriae]|uniref:Glycosyltransferase family 2 protein n=1 Tax=Listeria booriae TaxID=1552123 RepID=A0A7X1DQA6_9LIST|nr:glycosyltransferase family 2 protein [Listeria booriae]MBC2371019.1 glycosyltransferase family 2 protein [Listeria booriae]